MTDSWENGRSTRSTTRPFDMIVAGGTVVDMVTGEQRRADIAISGQTIVAVAEPNAALTAKVTVDATGTFVTPGLIDMFCHPTTAMVSPAVFARNLARNGTTTALWDPAFYYQAAGAAGLAWATADSQTAPVTMLARQSALAMQEKTGKGGAPSEAAEPFLQTLRNGKHADICGAYPHYLADIVKTLNALPQMPVSVPLSSGHMLADTFEREGGLRGLLRRLVRHGLAAEKALQAASFNAALYLGRHDLGLIAPGRRADIVLFSDLKEFDVKGVIAGGEMVEGHRSAHGTRRASEPLQLAALPADRLKQTLAAQAHALPVIDLNDRPEAQPQPLQLSRFSTTLPEGMTFMAEIGNDPQEPGQIRLFAISGLGNWKGALATTLSHKSGQRVVFGNRFEEMTVAANALSKSGGGVAITAGQWITALEPLPVFGLNNSQTVAETAERVRALRAAVDGIVEWKPPYMLLKILSGRIHPQRPSHWSTMGDDGSASDRLDGGPKLAAE